MTNHYEEYVIEAVADLETALGIVDAAEREADAAKFGQLTIALIYAKIALIGALGHLEDYLPSNKNLQESS